MALPTVKTLEECADFSKTVLPFVDQFYALPQQLLSTYTLAGLKELYLTTNPVISSFAISLVVAQAAFVISTINKNYSQIDRVWSILPAFYNCHYWLWAYAHGIRSQRLDAVAIFSVCWSARLTHNYWRKGGYEVGSEDYRWAIIKKYVNSVVWVVFNIVFISLIQSVLLAAVASPTYILLLVSRLEPALSGWDRLFPQIIAALLVIEFFSDNQQWEFQNAKRDYQRNAKVRPGFEAADLERGFVTTGLWSWSRHPNFAAEQAIWVALYQWACFDTSSLINWTFGGALNYLLVFQGSTPITEWITGGKYPEYKEYQARVGRFIPKLGGPSWADYAEQKKKDLAKEVSTPNGGSAKGKQGKKNK